VVFRIDPGPVIGEHVEDGRIVNLHPQLGKDIPGFANDLFYEVVFEKTDGGSQG
jgi:hypothetical protein